MNLHDRPLLEQMAVTYATEIERLQAEIARLRAERAGDQQLLFHLEGANEKLRAALEHTREIIALFYSLEPLSNDGKKQLLELRDVIDKALANE